MKAIKTKEEIAMNEFGLKDGANCPELWAGGSWQQWPLQPSMFQNIPHEQIDWAALAQQWIQMRETMGGPSNDQPPMLGGTVHAPPRPVDGNKPMKLENTDDGSNSQDTSAFRQGDWNYWNVNTPPPPPPAWNSSLHTNEAKESLPHYEFGQAHGNQGFAAQSYDYNHGSDQYGYNQVYGEQNQFNQYWPGGGGQSNAVFPRKEHRLQISEREGIVPSRDDEDMIALPSSLDAAKRKQLPAWIREGLEKMEREKQKRLEKERLLREREEQLRSMKEAEERAMKEFIEERGDSLIPRKSKFDSDSDEEEENLAKSPSPVKREYSSVEEEDDEAKSDEEKLADLMMRVRQLLTEILLEVTNEEVTQIAKEVLNRAKAKAPAMQLASSSALASITRGLGLDYGTDDSEESGGEEDDAVDSDVDLQVSINQRKKEFSEKEKEIVAGLKSDESDSEPDNGTKQVCDFLQPSPEREKYHFEKKYSEIPGLDVSSLPDETLISNEKPINEEIPTVKPSETSVNADKSATLNSSSDSDSEKDSRTSSSSRGRDKPQRRDRNRNSSRDRDRRRRSRSRDRRRSRSRSRSRSSSRNRRTRNFNRDRSNSRDRNRRSNYRRKERTRRSRSRSSSRRQRRDRGRRSRSYSRSRSRSPKKHSRRGRGRESRSPSGEGSGSTSAQVALTRRR